MERAQLQVYCHVISRTVISQDGQMETSTIISLNSFPIPRTNELPFRGLGSQNGKVQISTNLIQHPYFSIIGQQSLTEAQIQHEMDSNVNFDWNLEIRAKNMSISYMEMDTLLDDDVNDRHTYIQRWNLHMCVNIVEKLYGGCIDNSVNDGRGPYVFRINGKNHHRIGSLIPPDGRPATFAQFYIYDTQNELRNRMHSFNSKEENMELDLEIINELKEILDKQKFMGPSDLFITFTCNPKWSEVEKGLNFIPGQKVEDQLDIVA
ncbi:hypothetical protein ACH5RR_023403 [Cinchona calisaya]|uniref:Helitron helicase-like domain-containing protein n=1 Tax=Cinchona calisaya TaxID=153742 RepID=A0ABD2ZAJ9_9GENT